MQLAAGRRLGAVLGHLYKGPRHKPVNVVPYRVNTRTSATARVLMGTIACQMSEISYLLGNRYFFQPPAETKNEPAFKLVFTRGQRFEFLPSYYRHLAPGKRTTATVKLCSLGNTSWVTVEEIRDSSTNDLMVKGIFQRVNVSAIKRIPEPIPDWLKERYSYLTSSVPRPPTVQVFDVPKSTKSFRYSEVVAPRDTDSYHHTNQASYFWYCMDCATLGARSGAYSVLRGDLANNDLKIVEVLYRKESLEGDVLDIESWEDQDSPDTLRFLVRKGNENITQLTMQFYIPNI
ncbi:Hypp7115 [Branchiostoma lanceolatum]|uniref:Hypp7115 protein n=1 Tax=Branchiostoma lanceolatum TaxID=7740 RepID=A0A8J9YXA8_BRALA|nr:Hypp7115 [Branchiostoma lanceolatum]